MTTESNDYEWLLARERGEDVSHVSARTRAKYCQLDGLLKELPAYAPNPGWKQRVLDSIDDPLEPCGDGKRRVRGHACVRRSSR